ncbi:MAG: DNA polymerase alpha subunit B [Trebouxia sp. A1-2]|nr:MAG: DNA polymerase alpha subunit B [Trebouxia sp. A1-2]
MDDQLITRFKRTGYELDARELVLKCVSLAQQFDLTAKQFAEDFETFALNRKIATGLVNGGHLDAFSNSMNHKKRKRPPTEADTLGWAGNSWNDVEPDVLSDTSNTRRSRTTPAKAAKAVVMAPSPAITNTTSSSFSQRTQKGQVFSTLNAHLHFDDEAQVQYLDGRIGDFAAAFEDATGCHPSHPVYAACQEPVLMVGRICCDSEGRLNERSVLLEGSIELSNGMRTKLDLSKLEGFKLFLGQVVVVRGINPAGACIVAHQLYTAVPKPVVQTSLGQMQHFAQATGVKGLSMVVAAGPFSSKEDAAYEPLQALLTHCTTQPPPDVLVLMGPFVDANHPLVQAGMLEESYEDVFASQVIDRLDDYLDSAGSSCHVVLVPSTWDVHHHPVFPQPPFLPEAVPTRHPQQFTLLSNPGTFACNEVVVGVVTSDVIKHLSGQEVQRGPQGDRLPSFAAHLLGQQSYYPLYPPASGSLLDCSQASNLQLPVTPDILLLPSDLNPFAKLVPVRAPPPQGADTDAGVVQTVGQKAGRQH